VLRRRDVVPDIIRSLVRVADGAAHGLIVKDLNAWIRLEFLGVVARTGVAEALRRPRTLDELLGETALTDSDLREALLALGISLREIRFLRGRYRARGRRLRAIAGSSPDLRGVAEELVVYANRAYAAMDSHLRGAPAVAHDADCGAAIAAGSRIAEPILGPAVRAVSRREDPQRVLDIGCGSGAYLRHMLAAAPTARGLGIDRDAGAIRVASDLLEPLRALGRCELQQGDIEQLAEEIGDFDLVTLLNNIYYWPPERRSEILRTIRKVIAAGGVLMLATATTKGHAFNRHLDLMVRVTASSHRLPTRQEIRADLADAGYIDIETIEPVPKTGLLVVIARNPTLR
jgi:4-hydroxy-2,2'-bipyrrole-5-carbaldehyde O-methyltransferase